MKVLLLFIFALNTHASEELVMKQIKALGGHLKKELKTEILQ